MTREREAERRGTGAGYAESRAVRYVVTGTRASAGSAVTAAG